MMSRRATLRMVAGSLAAGSAVAAAPIRHDYIDDLTGFVPDCTDPISAVSNSAAIDAAFAGGLRTLHIRPGTSFAIARSLVLPNGGTLVGQGAGRQRPTIVMPATCFTNERGDVDRRYGPTAAGIVVTGGNRAAQAARGVRIANISLRSERRDGRVLRGIVARNVIDLELTDVDISGLPVGVAFCLASIRGNSRMDRCRAHDCRSDCVWGGQHPQITGLEIDNDRIDDIATTGLTVEGFRAEDLTVGPAFLAAHGYETDGINICATEAMGNRFRDILVRNVGEGIDTFGCDTRFERVVAQDCHIYGIKCIHGASRNVFDRPVIRNAGLAGITVSGSDERGDAVGNRFIAPRIEGIDPDGLWAHSESAAILIADNGGRRGLPRDTLVTDAVIDLGLNGKLAWLDTSHGSGNEGRSLQLRNKGSRSPALVRYGGGRADFISG